MAQNKSEASKLVLILFVEFWLFAAFYLVFFYLKRHVITSGVIASHIESLERYHEKILPYLSGPDAQGALVDRDLQMVEELVTITKRSLFVLRTIQGDYGFVLSPLCLAQEDRRAYIKVCKAVVDLKHTVHALELKAFNYFISTGALYVD